METGRRFAEEFLRKYPQEEDVRRSLATTYCNLGKVQFDRQCLRKQRSSTARRWRYTGNCRTIPRTAQVSLLYRRTLNQLGIVLNRGGQFAEASGLFWGEGLLQPWRPSPQRP